MLSRHSTLLASGLCESQLCEKTRPIWLRKRLSHLVSKLPRWAAIQCEYDRCGLLVAEVVACVAMLLRAPVSMCFAEVDGGHVIIVDGDRRMVD